MKVLSIKIIGLYGYLDKFIEFNRDINLLVGINGSGKTSVLNLLSWMLEPDMPELCLTKFNTVEVAIVVDRISYTLKCNQDNGKLFYSVSKDEGPDLLSDSLTKGEAKDFSPISVNIPNPEETYPVGSFKRRQALDDFRGLAPDEEELPLWTFLKKLPKPQIIGLERNLNKRELNTSRPESRFDLDPAEPQKTDVHKLASLAYKEYQWKINSLSTWLKDKFLATAFDPLGKAVSLDEIPMAPPITIEQVEELKNRVDKYLQSGVSKTARHDISINTNSFFSEVGEWINTYDEVRLRDETQSKLSYLLKTIQFERIKKFISYFEEYESRTVAAYAKIKKYLESVNKILADSGKQVVFEKRTLEIGFKIHDKDVLRNIESLSSGEKQIVILLTQVCFSKLNLFIIDEPELSLHPKWQGEILDEFINIMPPETQLFIATHSAALVGKNTKYCKVLLPYNQ